MTLLSLWQSNPEQFRAKRIEQVINFTGDGALRDNSPTSEELRQFLRNIPKSQIEQYCQECLEKGFKDSGLALQDLVNEVGRRLDFKVLHGRYRGVRNDIGYDGLWTSPKAQSIVVEVKTTDAYRMDLSVLARYREALIRERNLEEGTTSILIVVGREDTGDLEAQIRGSRYAWDIRVISVDSLLRLLAIKEEIEDPGIGMRIRSILIPREYTRVDAIIDVMFSTAEDILQEESSTEVPSADKTDSNADGGRGPPVNFHSAVAEVLSRHLDITLIRKSRAIFISPDEAVACVCAVSRKYETANDAGYWFAIHPHQLATLREYSRGFLGFGCGSKDSVLLFEIRDFEAHLDSLNKTIKTDGSYYWHVHFHHRSNRWFLHLKAGAPAADVSGKFVSF